MGSTGVGSRSLNNMGIDRTSKKPLPTRVPLPNSVLSVAVKVKATSLIVTTATTHLIEELCSWLGSLLRPPKDTLCLQNPQT